MPCAARDGGPARRAKDHRPASHRWGTEPQAEQVPSGTTERPRFGPPFLACGGLALGTHRCVRVQPACSTEAGATPKLSLSVSSVRGGAGQTSWQRPTFLRSPGQWPGGSVRAQLGDGSNRWGNQPSPRPSLLTLPPVPTVYGSVNARLWDLANKCGRGTQGSDCQANHAHR